MMSSTKHSTHRVAVARRRAQQLHALRSHLTVYAVVLVLLTAIDIAQGAGWWVGWVAFGWGIGVAAHAVSVARPTSRDEWIERKTEELLQRS
jgi:beta-lactamase class D